MVYTICLGLLLGTEAPVMTPNSIDFSFLSCLSGAKAHMQDQLSQPCMVKKYVIGIFKKTRNIVLLP